MTACDELYAIGATPPEADTSDGKFLPAAERILDCLDLSELPKELRDSAGVQSAVYLKEVLDRIDLPAEDEIPGVAKGTDVASTWKVPGTRLVIARAEEGPHRGEFLFTSETVRRAASFYKAARLLPYRDSGRPVSRSFHDRYVAATKRKPQQTIDTASPRGTLSLFLTSVNETYDQMRKQRHVNRSDPKFTPLVQQALSCLDVSELPEYSRDYHASEAVVCIKEILDRVTLPLMEDVPGVESLENSESGEKLVQWQIPKTELTIARVQEGPRRGAYLFSPETVQRATELYEKARKQPYHSEGIAVSQGLHDWWLSSPGNSTVAAVVDRLPTSFQNRFFGLAIWQWTGLLFVIPIGVILMYLALRIGRAQGEQTRESNLVQYWASLLFPIVAMLVPLVFKHIAFEYLTIRGNALYYVAFAADLVFLLALLVVVGGGCSRIAETIVALPNVRARGVDGQLIRIVGRLVGVVAAAVVFLEGGRYLGFPLTTLLASAGISGLAIALAGQSMLKGLFGTLTIMLDKPFREGERIVVKGHDGFVEEIGLRSTKIRTFLTNHLVAIPNDQMADSEIENIGRRAHIRRMSDLHIPLDTPREKVDQAVIAIRAALSDHEGMDPKYPPRVYFHEFSPDSFIIRVIYWYQPAELWAFYEFSEKINLEIFRLFEERGIQFSLPLRHSYWKQDSEQGPLDVNLCLSHSSDVTESRANATTTAPSLRPSRPK